MAEQWENDVIEYNLNKLGGILGYNISSYRNLTPDPINSFTDRWTKDLGALGGYYDAGKVNSLISGLGGTTSASYYKQMQALSEQANKVYSYIQNPDSITTKLQAEADRIGYGAFLALNTGYMPKRDHDKLHMQGGYYADIMGNRRDVLMSPTMSVLYETVNRIRDNQNTISAQLTAQQQKEQSFVTQITQITQQATLAKSKAEQAAAQKAMQEQYAKQQAELDKQAQANAAKLAEQQKQQQQQYEQAQAQQAEQARKQQATLNATAAANATKNASNAQVDAAKLSVSQMEQQASQTRGGEAIVSTNAAPAKAQRGQTTRTERWQSSRQPAPGGGGIRT